MTTADPIARPMLPYLAPPPIQQWLCCDTVAELRGDAPRVLPVRPHSGTELTWTDALAGAGGSSQGIVRVMLGNAVTPPAASDLAACLMEAVTGIDIPLAAAV